MNNNRPFRNIWVKLDIFLSLFVVTSVFCLIFVLTHRVIFDRDIWLHLKTGEFIFQNKIIPAKDIFSFTLKAKPWVDHEWLFQTVSYLTYHKWQTEGLISLETYIIFLSFLVLFLMGYKQIRSYMAVSVLIVITAYGCASRFNIRPDIFSMFFFSLYLYLLRFHMDKKIIWLLLPIQVLWVNFHGYFFLGPLLTLFFIAAEFLRRNVNFLPWQWKEEFALNDVVYRRLKIVFVFIVLACLINPGGFRGALYPFGVFKEILRGENQIFFKHIQELKPISQMNYYSAKFYYFIIFFCFLLMSINFKRLKLIEIFLVIFFFLFAFTQRNITFFAFIGYTVIVSYLGPTLRKISTNVKLGDPLRQRLGLFLKYGLVIFLTGWIWLKISKVSGYGYYDFNSNTFISFVSGTEHRRYPERAVDFLLRHNIKANLFNDFNSGAYLIGMGYPEIKVFIDGRTELYGAKFYRQYRDVIDGDTGAFERVMDKYNITAILFSLTYETPPNIINYIYTSPQWKMVFFDELGLVFLKDTPSNKDLIDSYKIDLSRYHTQTADLHILGLREAEPWSYINRASLFNLLKEDALVIQESKEALRIMPDCARAHHLLGKAYLRKGLYQEALENLRATLLFMPRNVEALVDLSKCLSELKDDKAAMDVLKRAIRFNRRYSPAYYHLGGLYLAENNYTEAIRALDKALSYTPADPRYHLKLAAALYGKAKISKDINFITQAKEELRKSAELNIQNDLDLANKIQAQLEEIGRLYSSVSDADL